LAVRDITAESRGAAHLDGAHHLKLCVAHVAAVGVTPSGPEVAEDIPDFQSGTLHKCAGLLRRTLPGRWWREQIEWARVARAAETRSVAVMSGRGYSGRGVEVARAG
jgi:hypothetical protein